MNATVSHLQFIQTGDGPFGIKRKKEVLCLNASDFVNELHLTNLCVCVGSSLISQEIYNDWCENTSCLIPQKGANHVDSMNPNW